MAKKTLIKVTGTQRLGRDKDKIELTTVGTMEEKPNSYVFCYNEEQEPPLRPVQATLTVFKDEKRVEILRSGDNGSLLIIERAKRNLCSYGTPYGELLMGIYGKSIENRIGEKQGTVTFGYDIDVNGALTSQNEVKLEYKIH
ncbi:MAG: DUF1934 domain-containing protein [Eubacterium sp.]|nr:DUF1934 domain-containing protein [Eubacterium sp.]